MKITVTISRIIVGVLFIFSGLVKAIDPLGLSYKMQEFFEVWADEGYLTFLMNFLHSHSFLFSIIIITLEVALGVALLVGWKKKLTLRLLLLLMLFFTFLTSYVLFSGKIRTCGCFGDCIPLTPVQTFTKDIILLGLVCLLLWKQRYIKPLFDDLLPFALILISVIGVLLLQMHVVKYLPLVDCLPYKKGNDLLKLRQMPEGAIPDKYEYSFVYKKDGVKSEFNANQLPDSTWKFLERKQTLIEKGKNNIPLINDFSLTDSSGADVTESVLGQNRDYYLFFLKDLDNGTRNWSTAFDILSKKSKQQNRPIYIVTSEREKMEHFFNEVKKDNIMIYSCDATAIKTAARANPTLFLMRGPVVQAKYSWAELDKAIKD